MSNTDKNINIKQEDIISNIENQGGDNDSFVLVDAYQFVKENVDSVVKDIKNVFEKFSEDVVDIAESVYLSAKTTVENVAQTVWNAVPKTKEDAEALVEQIWTGGGDLAASAGDLLNSAMTGANGLTDDIANHLQTATEYGLGKQLQGIFNIVSTNMASYKDGISETSFGSKMEDSWQGKSSAFLNYFKEQHGRINFMDSTPLDAGRDKNSLYGTMMLGAPYTFNSFADPNNRTLINTFIKDGKFVSITPGMPKYNGLTSYLGGFNTILDQTSNGDEMLSYLSRNGIDSLFALKDKRYYTFEASYDEYFSYLETMLNAVWIKLGLAKNGEQFNLFTFINIKTASGKIKPSGYKELKPQYNSSIGFFCNAASVVSESVDNQRTSFGSELAGEVNAQAQEMQRINYITGMGTGGAGRELSRKFGMMSNVTKQIGGLLSETFSGTAATLSKVGDIVASNSFSKAAQIAVTIAAGAVSAVKDVATFTHTKDFGSVLQGFATSNGMQVTYPELWSSSSYSRPININFNFVSPYGDPLSIFKYVFVPFCALVCFALPRQAAENGFVSPFLIRADMPGVFTTDLGMISSISWQRGGDQSLWTKDGLPRAISGSFTITDLYEYLAMTKRLSFLSANPSYTVFLDSLTGMCAVTDDGSSDSLNDYFKFMIDRANGKNTSNALWNRFGSNKLSESARISNLTRSSISGNLNSYSIPWIHNSSLF